MTQATQVDERECAVEDCHEWGKPQVCVYDGRYHHHGRIHYENGHPFHPELRFRGMDEGGWRGICNTHMKQIKAGAARAGWSE